MNCPSCSRENPADAAYCAACGTSLHGSAPRQRRLTRYPKQGHVAGVCSGLAAYLAIDVTIVRLLWIVLSIVPGAVIGGVIAYLAAWVLMPEASDTVDTTGTKRLLRSFSNRKISGVCGGLAEYLGLDATLVRVVAVVLTIYPGAVIGGVIAYAVAIVVIPPAPPTQFEPATAST
jgi:phage shock protein PspC (stress-responsive transcriptional regulator)